ncbi:hypothetical protein F5050DRAFT_1804492 [Lentinula boryana]|uniref:DNA breaking-rejoining enzyme n=1 Tax=Lentinula boryana TaxID=40481 RepID=A0ABQ8QNM0_9AGAR|nr:hypothetical protein F5050DRAFT_1804492 [Lentinula boryana]
MTLTPQTETPHLHYQLASRKANTKNYITPSIFRPHILAKDRIHAWSTPYAESKRLASSSKYSHQIISWGDKAMSEALKNSSKSSYGRESYTDETLLTGFIGFHLGGVVNVKGWLSGIRAWHDFNGAPWPTDSRQLCLARSGARAAGANRKCPIRNPITLSHLLALYFSLDFSKPFHCAIWAIALICFWGCRRLGELTIGSKNSFNSKYNASRSTFINFQLLPNKSPKAINFHIPWTKTTKESGASVTATAQSGELAILCPFLAIKCHLESNHNVPNSFSLFAYLDDNNTPQHMVKHLFLNFCDSIWKKKGLMNVHGHSFRIGGAVELLIAKVPPEIIAAIGGWTSLAFLIYWCRFEKILLAHILKAYDNDQVSRLQSTLDDFRISNRIPKSVIDTCANGIDISDYE